MVLLGNCGDHVVVINSKFISMPAHEWEYRVYFHHTGYPGGASKTPAWELQEKDSTMVMFKAIYLALSKVKRQRRELMQRLYIFPESEIPENVKNNITDQIVQIQKVPQRLDEYSEDEIKKFPKLFDYPVDYVLK